MNATFDSAQHAATLLTQGQYAAALEYLNGTTGHRFTALYRRDGDRAWNVVLFDRTSPLAPQFPEVGADETYCSIAMRDCQVFVVRDSLADPYLATHPAREVVRSYCGTPLMDANGEPFGTLCHFDFEPVEPSAAAAELLRQRSTLMNPQSMDAALHADVARRMHNLESMLPLLAASSEGQASREDGFDFMAEPVHALLPRLPADAAMQVRERIEALAHRYAALCALPDTA